MKMRFDVRQAAQRAPKTTKPGEGQQKKGLHEAEARANPRKKSLPKKVIESRVERRSLGQNGLGQGHAVGAAHIPALGVPVLATEGGHDQGLAHVVLGQGGDPGPDQGAEQGQDLEVVLQLMVLDCMWQN